MRCYLRDAENKMICESVTISSELSDHSRAAAIGNRPFERKKISICHLKLTLLYAVMVFLHSSATNLFLNCC